MNTEMKVARRATVSDVRAPKRMRTNRSRPAVSTPNQNWPFGPFGSPNESVISRRNSSSGPWWAMWFAMTPAKTARRIRIAITNRLTIANLSLLNRCQKICQGVRPTTASSTPYAVGSGVGVPVTGSDVTWAMCQPLSIA